MRVFRTTGAAIAVLAGLSLGAAALGQPKDSIDRGARAEASAPSPGDAPPEPAASAAGGSEVVAPPDEGGAPPSDPTPETSATNSLPDPDPAPAPEPLRRPRFDTAILQAVDKITAETLRFEVRVGESVRYKGLVLTVRACEGAAADEAMADAVANLDVTFQPLTVAGRSTAAARSVFHGWMFASSPGLHPLEQPSYDVWVIACRAATGPGASA